MGPANLRGGPSGLLLNAVARMTVEPLPLAGALLVTPAVFHDDRGYFKEIFSSERYRAAGIPDEFVQDNVSVSKRGVVRGLHGDDRMSKLVQVIEGEAYDAIVDARPDSPTYGRAWGTTLRAGEHRQIYVPRGFLHGFLALSAEVVFLYKQSAHYDPSREYGVAWNDPEIAIPWPLAGIEPVVSAKDAANPPLRVARPR